MSTTKTSETTSETTGETTSETTSETTAATTTTTSDASDGSFVVVINGAAAVAAALDGVQSGPLPAIVPSSLTPPVLTALASEGGASTTPVLNATMNGIALRGDSTSASDAGVRVTFAPIARFKSLTVAGSVEVAFALVLHFVGGSNVTSALSTGAAGIVSVLPDNIVEVVAVTGKKKGKNTLLFLFFLFLVLLSPELVINRWFVNHEKKSFITSI